MIFLDIDGVMNTMAHLRQAHGLTLAASTDAACIKRLQRLSTRTGAVVVVSSTWRHGTSLKTFAKVLGVPVIDKTGESRSRGDEVREWLLAHPSIKQWVILDDDNDFRDEQWPNIVTTVDGLTDADVEKAVAILGT